MWRLVILQHGISFSWCHSKLLVILKLRLLSKNLVIFKLFDLDKRRLKAYKFLVFSCLLIRLLHKKFRLMTVLTKWPSDVFLISSWLNRTIRTKFFPFDHFIFSRYLLMFPFQWEHCVYELLMLVPDKFYICCQLQVLCLKDVYFIFEAVNPLTLFA
jgi:hypothetical protein